MAGKGELSFGSAGAGWGRERQNRAGLGSGGHGVAMWVQYGAGRGNFGRRGQNSPSRARTRIVCTEGTATTAASY